MRFISGAMCQSVGRGANPVALGGRGTPEGCDDRDGRDFEA